MLVYIWRYWCEVESAYFEIESASPPTSHGAHAIDASKSVIVGFLNSDKRSGGGRNAQAIFSEDETKPYAWISDISWVAVGSLRFPGTDAWTPTAMVAVLERFDNFAFKHAVRLYDVTHAKVVCDSGLVLFPQAPTVHSVTAFSNLPAGESVFEVQVKSESTNCKGKIYWVDLEG